MPRRDRTGPEGRGPRTGRGRGICTMAGVAVEIDKRLNGAFGGGRARGPRDGRGRGRYRGVV